jgi:hypothetical protein
LLSWSFRRSFQQAPLDRTTLHWPEPRARPDLARPYGTVENRRSNEPPNAPPATAIRVGSGRPNEAATSTKHRLSSREGILPWRSGDPRSAMASVACVNRSHTARAQRGLSNRQLDGCGGTRGSAAWFVEAENEVRTNTDTAAGSGSRSRSPWACRPPARGTRATRSADRPGRVLPFVPHLHEHSDVTWPERAAGDQLTTASPGIASAGGAACAPAAA